MRRLMLCPTHAAAIFAVALVAFTCSAASAATSFASAWAAEVRNGTYDVRADALLRLGWFDSYAARAAILPSVESGAWSKVENNSKKTVGGYKNFRSTPAEWRAAGFLAAANSGFFIIDGPEGLAEIHLSFATVPGVVWPDDVPVDRDYLPAVQSMYAIGASEISMFADSFITDGTSIFPLGEGSLKLSGGSDSAAPRFDADGIFAGRFFTITDGLRTSAHLEADLLTVAVRVPTNTQLEWFMDLRLLSDPEDPGQPDANNLPAVMPFGAGGFFSVDLGLVDPTTYSLRSIPEPSALALLPLAMLLGLRRRR